MSGALSIDWLDDPTPCAVLEMMARQCKRVCVCVRVVWCGVVYVRARACVRVQADDVDIEMTAAIE